MKEQTRLRLNSLSNRYAKRLAATSSEGDDAVARAKRFLDGFVQVRSNVLLVVMKEIGDELARGGHGFRVDLDADGIRPNIELHLRIKGALPDSKNVIRLFARTDGPQRVCEVIAELELRRSPMELTRFQQLEEMTPEVVEKMFVDAIEQVFACNGG